ncbi:MAG: thiolase family protein [Bdellovibrionaceae bacterium]|nr:thiolase family protein [Pseudobdellovibrionaceae bacterium]MDW8190241.1 thiolase family protein [Pseudobdellovibrionaceae bacterium]
MEQVHILDARRTPIGSFLGQLSSLPAPKLGASVIAGLLRDWEQRLNPSEIGGCIMGQVLTGGSGQAPARQAAIYAGLPPSVACTTVNKVCGSGLKAVMMAADAIRLKQVDLMLAGGQESMSQAPFLVEGARSGYRMGHQKLIDSMLKDGLWDPYSDWHMGQAAELCVREFRLSREEQDRFAMESYKKAQKAQQQGWFEKEIIPVTYADKKGEALVKVDEEPSKVIWDKIPSLKPAFEKDGSITAANASKINDGASVLLLASATKARSMGQKGLARIVSYASYAQDPKWFTTAPVGAIKKALELAQLTVDQIDLWEINEAFAAVTLVTSKELQIPLEKINVHGGAVALGHPIGASGARILTTLIHALVTHRKRYGLATLCIGGGEAVAMIVESLL